MKLIASLVFVFTITATLSAGAAEYVVDDFDSGADARVTSFVVTPDNSGNISVGGAPGAFDPNSVDPPNSGLAFDIFGRTSRIASFDFGDDSGTGLGNPGEFADDTFGIVPFSGPNGRDDTDHFFGTNDVQNAANPDGGGTAIWTIDISGLSNLSLTAVFSAMGDFEAGDNSHTFEATIDGGTAQTLFAIDTNETDYRDGAEFVYTMEGGAEVAIQDPLEITDDFGTRVIDNTFSTTATSAITGTGSVLTITYTAGVNNGGGEPFGFDNLVLSDEALVLPDADFDDSGSVDGTDLATWEGNYGTAATTSTGDADGDSDADGADFLQWQQEFTTPVASATTAVPEPTSLVLVGLAVALLPVARRQRK